MKKISKFIVCLVAAASMPVQAFAQSDNTSLATIIQSDENLVAANPNDTVTYKDLGKALQEEGNTDINVFVNGQQLNSDVKPFISNGRTLTPVRAISESLGANVGWKPDTQNVTIANGNHTISLTINSNRATIDGKNVPLDAPASIVNGRTFLPMRFISQAFGASVDWYPVGQIVAIAYSNASRSATVIKAPIISQMPDLRNGCEVTSMTMLLNWAGKSISKSQVAADVYKDPSPEVKDPQGNIVSWGDPAIGFVGDITGTTPGYAVFHGPFTQLLNQYMPGQALDLTGSSFSNILAQVKSDKPVAVWTTVSFMPTNDWISWQGPNGIVKATFNEHCVLLVGFDDHKQLVYLNDPLDGIAAKPVSLAQFKASWEQLGSQAVSLK